MVPAPGAEACLSHYGLRVKPFQANTDPRFLSLGRLQRDALVTLRSAILTNQGLLLLTGDVGTGKTTLANALLDSLGDALLVARILYPGLDPPELFRVLADAYGMDAALSRPGSVELQLRHVIQTAHAANKQLLLILDEAQDLTKTLFEALRDLSDVQDENEHRLNILLVGESHLSTVLMQTEHRTLGERIAIRCHIEPLTERETDEYIRHRLWVAGAERAVFSPDAAREVFTASGGIPRLINTICHCALLKGFGRGAGTITAEIIRHCAKDLGIGNAGEPPDALPEASQGVSVVSRPRKGTALTRRAAQGPKGRLVAAGLVSVALLGLMLIVAGYVDYPGRSGAMRQGPIQGSKASSREDRAPEMAEVRRGPDLANARITETEAAKRETLESPPISPANRPSEGSLKDDAPSQTEPPVASAGSGKPPGKPGASPPRDETTRTTQPSRRPETSRNDSLEGADAADPTAVIDWLLRESSGREP